jgi:hypothetical protein
MWDVLSWHDGTLSIAWWALIAVAVLVVIAAGSGLVGDSARAISRLSGGLASLALCLPVVDLVGERRAAGEEWHPGNE